ncbi:tyrosine-type recombinase/integrase [uncultured Ruminobacter sp.]|uniref:tyrosine-type recombinase/integrase n=1 Tax=uncultured Ruminobacter sp. TaxID=538947 RepID=UPI0025D33227|nr:tyrosine-type recombinase/integrase [uncultured Ruminobacter sp.]
MTVDKILDNYGSYVRGELGLSDATVNTYVYQLKTFMHFLSGRNVAFTDFTVDDFEAFLAYVVDELRHKETTTVISINAVRSFMKFLRVEGLRKDNPLENVSTPKLGQRIPKVISHQEVMKMLHELGEDTLDELRDKCILLFIYGSGLRSSEVMNLSYDMINYESQFLKIKGKGSKERQVPVSDEQIRVLNLYTSKLRELMAEKQIPEYRGTQVFINPKTGRVFTRQYLFLHIKKLVRKVGIVRNVSAHTLRHAFATELLDNGADLKSIQELLGHSSMTTTEIYTHVAKSRMHKIYEKTHPRS